MKPDDQPNQDVRTAVTSIFEDSIRLFRENDYEGWEPELNPSFELLRDGMFRLVVMGRSEKWQKQFHQCSVG